MPNMYKKRNLIRITSFIIFLCVGGIVYLLMAGTGAAWETYVSYGLGGIALVGLIIYWIQSRQFKGALNSYFDRKKMEQ